MDSSPSAFEELNPATVAACEGRQQGDVVQVSALAVHRPTGIIYRPTPEGVVLLSQTCDIVLADRFTVVAAPLVRLSGDTLRDADKGKKPRYVLVPQLGADAFADLDVIGTLHKDVLAGAPTVSVVGSDDIAIRNFGRRVGRRFERFAFPDEVVPWFNPLSDVVLGKYGGTTGEALAFEQVVELRVEATDGWISAPYALTLVVIVRGGTLPEIDEDDQVMPPTSLQQWLRRNDGSLRRASGEIANRLFKDRLDASGNTSALEPRERYHLWLALAEAWGDRCRPRGRYRNDPSVANAVRGGAVGVEILSDDEYTLARYRRSEMLDLDHLSPPSPE
jgi:hypothetical protein